MPTARFFGPAVLAGTTLLLALTACGRSGSGARNAELGSFRGDFVGARVDPTIRPARLLPETVDETSSYGSESGGGTRVITSGLRVVTSPKGGILAAEERFPQPPLATSALPERLGGGFLFVVGSTLWRADRWLGPAKPIFTAANAISAVIPGLDRVYLRSQNVVLALDGRNGHVLDLGPWPASPYVASYAAADGWRAAAVTDLRGVVATFDAGATWRPLELPIEPKQVIVAGENLAIGGFEGGPRVATANGSASGNEAWYELRPDGSLARLGGAPREAKTKLTGGPTSSPSIRMTFGPSGPMPAVTRGTSSRPAPAPTASVSDRAGANGDASEQEDYAVKTFGKRPLATAIEDGWPLTDGTAVVARDGSLARVRLADGALTELVRDAFPMTPARCHPVSLTRPTSAGAFGFVCGEPRGATVLYAYEPLRGRLLELRRWTKPRVITSSGNGAVAVQGSCDADADPPAPPMPDPVRVAPGDHDDEHGEPHDKDGKRDRDRSKSKTPDPGSSASALPTASSAASASGLARPAAPAIHPYCVLGHDNVWREIHVRGDVGGERVVVLTDGRIVVLSPPQGPTTPARITILDHGKATTLPVAFPRVTNDVARVLKYGLWLDGFEERQPGVVGGWLEAGGVMLGLEVGLDGKATPGQFIRDAGTPFVSGKYGIGWSASRRGYETSDGGMTWSTLEVPDPLVPTTKVERRACGPIGCLANGWLRVGWGEPKREPPPSPPPAYRPTNVPVVPQLQLACEPTAPMAPPVPASRTATAPIGLPPTITHSHLGSGGPPVLSSVQGATDLPPFFFQPAPVVREPDRGVTIEVRDLVERYPNVGPLARVYGWGPKTGDWDTLGRWQVRWLSPFAGWPEIHSTLATLPPASIVDLTRSSYGFGVSFGGGTRSDYQLAPGEDPSHALLIGKRNVNGATAIILYDLEADRAPIEIHRADGEPFGEIEGAARVGGRWFVSTAATSSGGAVMGSSGIMMGVFQTSPFTVVWQVEGSTARELIRVPRAIAEGATNTPSRARLARRSDGHALALVVEGQPTPERPGLVRWAQPIDLENGALGEPEPLGYGDLAGRTLEGCSDDLVGWVLDTPIAGSTVKIRLPGGSGSLGSVQARVRLTRERVCIERIAGTYDGQSTERAAQLTRGGAKDGARSLRQGEMLVTAMSAQNRFALRCSVAK